ncbi:Nucleoporin protein Ndc1-Nup protein [Dioscorea alata]|uniref:Nucleoporin protein Ndc1-Nup protein n=1 Tax=Dioscorea alata TaxID=55571 RepID=A0ACB7TZP6_DIOAL|nr:Nucleoporin protein Ndc1-Nup protein [Dioscorea alata]
MAAPEDVVKNRWLGFLIWQSIAGASVYLPSMALLLRRPRSAALSLLSFLSFHLSLLLLCLSFFLLSSPRDHHFLFVDFRRRAHLILRILLFFLLSSVAGFLSVASVCVRSEILHAPTLAEVALTGSAFGMVYALQYLLRKRWVLQFPIIQRPLFFSFKMGLSACLRRALKLSAQAVACSTVLVMFVPYEFRSEFRLGRFLNQLFNFYIGTSVASFCWELSHHLLQVVHTRRCSFAPPKGSAAAETNPSEILLETLEQSSPRSLVQYLAYLDLCAVSESNVEAWRRAAFLEESGETYRRVIAACLRPLEQLASMITEGLEGYPKIETDLLNHQLNFPTYTHADSRLLEAFNDFQLFTWCARAAAAITASSHSEDRYGVAQLTGCNAAVVSTLLSCLLAVEACLGKKTSPQTTHLLGPGNIRWASMNTVRKNGVTSMRNKIKSGILNSKAYAMADVLRTSIYQIVSVFHADMQANAKSSVLDKNWIVGKPLYGSREVLLQKLNQFLEFCAN